MSRDVQLPGPAAELLRVAGEVTPSWLRRLVVQTAVGAGVDPGDVATELEALVAVESRRVLDQLFALLAVDVDEQRTNPLSIYRSAVAAPTALLRRAGVPEPRPDPFVATAFPDDAYALGPATWSDIDPALHEPGLAWGAWKAMTVLRRRRDEGRR
jgi:hypothetical protein